MGLGSGAWATIAGAAMPVAVQAAAAAVRRRGMDKADEALSVAADLVDPGIDILDRRSPRYDERIELLRRIGASRPGHHPEQIRALGRVLADGVKVI